MPPLKPEFILITGPNGAGKTSFIAENLHLLKDFTIIKPDELTGYWDHFTKATAARQNIVFESPFNDASLSRRLDELHRAGYQLTMYQLFLDSLDASLIRVNDRNPVAHYQLDRFQVKENFNANFINVCTYYFYFDNAYFVNNARHDAKEKLYLAFHRTEIKYYRKNNSPYLRLWAEVSHQKGRLDERAFMMIMNNKTYRTDEFKKPKLKTRTG